MIKLFLVEDEIAMREGIRRHIRWEEEGIDFCGEASDGELAWPLIQEHRPDIIITDIKMPFMDGLQLSRLIRAELPAAKIVILSGYTEFRYAQEALRIGVTEYLVKPIKPKDLRSVISRLAREVEEEKKSRQEQTGLKEEEEKERQGHIRKKFFRSLISGELSSHQILNLSEEAGLKFLAPCYQILLLNIQYATDLGKQQEVEDALSSVEEEFPGCFLFEYSIDSQAILLTDRSDESLAQKRADVIEKVISPVRAADGQRYFISVGKTVRHLSEIRDSYQEANRSFSYRFFLPPDQIIFGDVPFRELLDGSSSPLSGARINIETALQNEGLRSAWDNFLRTGTQMETADFLEDVFSSVGEDNTQSFIFLSYLTMDCYFTMVRFLKELGREPEDVNSICGDINSVMGSLISAAEARDYLTRYLQEVIRIRDGSTQRKNYQVLQNAVTYIDSNFADEDMSLHKAAQAAGLSPNRFSTLFSQEMGMTFIEYLTARRMDKAKELLMTTDLRSSEIAWQAGYKDPHYFSATFKKIQGMSPREYRMRGKDEHENERN